MVWPQKRYDKTVIRGFVHPDQLFALVAPRAGQPDWREVLWGEFLKVKVIQRHLRTPQFVALLCKYRMVQPICESGLWGEQDKSLLSVGMKFDSAELCRLVQTLSFERLRAAFFVWWYWMVSRSDCLIWQSVADQQDQMQGFLLPAIWSLEKRIDNLVWGLNKRASVHLQLLASTLFCRMVDYFNRHYSKPFLVMPTPVAYLTSKDDSLNPAHALYASAGSAFRVGLDMHIVKLLTQADRVQLATALQWVYVAENLISQSKAGKWLQIPFAQASAYQGFVVLNPHCKSAEPCDERWLSDRAALIWTTLAQVAHADYQAGLFQTGGQRISWNQISPSCCLNGFSIPGGAVHIQGTKTPSFKERSFALFQTLQVPIRYWDDLYHHSLQALSGSMQQSLCGMLLNHLRYPFQTHSLPGLKPACVRTKSKVKLGSLDKKLDTVPDVNCKEGIDLGSDQKVKVLTAPHAQSNVLGTERYHHERGAIQAFASPRARESELVFLTQEDESPFVSRAIGIHEDLGNPMMNSIVQIESVVPSNVSFRQWLELAKGNGLAVAQAYARCLQSGCDCQAVVVLKNELENFPRSTPAWVCALDFITHKVNLLSQKLQTKTLKKVGELKPLFHYFLPAFDLCASQHDWSEVTNGFESLCVFYDQMLDTRFGQHSVRDQLGSLILEFHKDFVSKYLNEQSASDLILEREDLNLDPRPDATVRVHYASPSSYREVLDLIAIKADRMSKQEQVTLALLHILLYRLTLRRGEILALRLGDFFWAGFNQDNPQEGLCQVIIRGKHLKSNCANRVITLHGLLTPDELTLVHARYKELACHDNWRVSFFILSPLGVSPTQFELEKLPKAGQSQLDRLLKVWRTLPNMADFTVHSYRHCAINNALVHLTLARLQPQQRAVSLLPWMHDEEFSQRRNIEVTQSITALPVSADVRQIDIAFELIRLCGHLHFRTTRSTYIHLFPWLTLVALNGSHKIMLSKADWSKVLGLKGRANVDQRGPLKQAHGIDGALDSGMPSVHLLVGCIIGRLRKVGLLKQLG